MLSRRGNTTVTVCATDNGPPAVTRPSKDPPGRNSQHVPVAGSRAGTSEQPVNSRCRTAFSCDSSLASSASCESLARSSGVLEVLQATRYRPDACFKSHTSALDPLPRCRTTSHWSRACKCGGANRADIRSLSEVEDIEVEDIEVE